MIAYGDDYLQPQYYLAAQADEVYLHPEGMVLIYGFGGHYNFYKEGLDRFGIEMHVFRVGEYKSAVEPYLRNDMSQGGARDVARRLRRPVARLARGRGRGPQDHARRHHGARRGDARDRLRAAGGDLATLARQAKLVDTLAPRDEVRKRLIELVGEDKENHSFKQVGFATYLKAKGGDRSGATGRGKAVAVVVAKGTILDGTQPAGTVGGDSTARLLRRAREDEAVRAVVLRVDSPGGSAFASEIIRRECELVRKAGKPLVVSMGSVAASGGYWIATASDEIWAAPETITGSIGIFGVFPSIHKPLAKYFGIHTDGVGTTRFTDALRPDRPLDPGVADVIQQWIDNGYQDFLARVGEARKMSPEQVDKIGRGRIWSGEDAKGLGLVDQLGTLAAGDRVGRGTRAKLEKGYRVWYVEKEKSFREQARRDAHGRRARRSAVEDDLAASRSRPSPPFSVASSLRQIERDVREVARWNDPRGIYAHCLCGDE